MNANDSPRTWVIFSLLFVLAGGCQHKQEDAPQSAVSALPHDEVLLPANSAKRAYVEEQTAELVLAPVMEAYDETRTVRISAPISGRVISGIPALGATVKARDPLMEMDSPELGQAKRDYANAIADQHLAEEAYTRAKALFEGRVLPRKELQQAEAEVVHARNEIQRSLMHLQNLGVTGDQINNRYLVRSPISGVITERHVNPGMEVRPDLADPLIVVSDLHSLWLYMSVFEKDLSLIEVGDSLLVKVPAYPDRQFPAKIEYIDKLVDDATRTVKVRCSLGNADGKLLPAMYATVEVLGDHQKMGIVIPLSALFTEGEGDQIFVKLADGHYKQRAVRVGLRLKDRALILDGLAEGETYVSKGALMLRTEEANEQTATSNK